MNSKYGRFLDWLQSRHPRIWQELARDDISLDGLSDASTAPASQAPLAKQASWVENLTAALPVLAQTYREAKLVKINLDRAKAGQEPIEVNAPAVRVEHSVGGFDQRTLLLAAAALGLTLVLIRMR